jgi:cohesin domain-containing protein
VLMSDIAEVRYRTDTVLTVTVLMDMRASGELLGSTTVSVYWNPSALTYQSYANGGSGVSPTVNASNAAAGLLTLAMADPNGFAGRVELLKITFKAGSVAGTTGSLALTTSEVSGAGTFTDLLPRTVAVTYPLSTR